MPKLTTALALLILAAGLTSAANAEQYIPSREAESNIKSVTSSISWLTSLDQVKAKAHAERKPILWIHMLGNIDGFT